jgi:hypothetical protein
LFAHGLPTTGFTFSYQESLRVFCSML